MPLFGKSWTICKVFGFPIRLHPSWLVLLCLLVYTFAGPHGIFRTELEGEAVSEATFWMLGVLGALGLFASLIAHELCHSFVARRTGMPVKGITLFIFGGVCELGAMPPTAGSEFIMAAVGPLSSMAIGMCCLLVWWAGGHFAWPATVRVLLRHMWFVNFALAFFNSIPAFPLDGGRVVRSVIWGMTGSLRTATTIAAWIGSAFGFAMIMGGAFSVFVGGVIPGVWLMFIGFFLSRAARGSLRHTMLREGLIGERVSHFMKTALVAIPPGISLRQFVDHYVLPYEFAAFPVVDEEGQLIGIICSGAAARVDQADWDSRTVGDVMSEAGEAIRVSPDTSATEALNRLTDEQGRRLVVVEQGRPIGIVSLRDVLEFVALKLNPGRRRIIKW